MPTTETVTPRRTSRIRAAGTRAARVVFEKGSEAARIAERAEPEYAEAAVMELGRLLDSVPGLLREQMEAAEHGAQDLLVRPEHALAEIAQNADDCGATWLRLGIRQTASGRELLAVHNGFPVRLIDMVGMSLAWVSPKRRDARAKGKFGIGLKTVLGMAPRFDVHSSPYQFSVSGQRPTWVAEEPEIAGFWHPARRETLLVLHLRDEYDASGAVNWVREWGASSLVFMDQLSRIEMIDLTTRSTLACQEVHPDSTTSLRLDIAGRSTPVDVTLLVRTAPSSDGPHAWTRYLMQVSPPSRLRRSHKHRDRTTPVGIAIAEHGETGRVFAGLPLPEPCSLPFSVHGQFDPDTARARLKNSAWNAYLLERAAHLVIAVLRQRFGSDPASAWRAVPMRGDQAGSDPWTQERFADVVARVRSAVSGGIEISLPSGATGLRYVRFESEPVTHLLDDVDLQGLVGDHPVLVRTARDHDGRWRDVLTDLDIGEVVRPLDALRMFEWPPAELGPRSARWFADVAEAALQDPMWSTASRRRLSACPSLPLASGERLAPSSVLAKGQVIAAHAPPSSLAARLGLLCLIDPAYLAAAEKCPALASWLKDEVGVAREPAAEDVLRALARRSPEDPLELGDKELKALRDALSFATEPERIQLGGAIGERVVVRGTETSLRRRRARRLLVRPSRAYLPSRIDGHAENFWHAAQSVPGLLWIESRYAELLKSRDRRRLSARAFFTLLGASSSPRLECVVGTARLRDETAEPLHHPLAVTQAQAIAELDRRAADGYWVDHLQHDCISPDLDAVFASLQKLRSGDRRQAARALLLSVARNWDSVYAQHAVARGVHRYHIWNDLGPVPATWLARVQSERWLSSRSGKRRAPRELALRSAAYLRAVGDNPGRFCAEVEENELASHVAEALGFEARPRASTLIEALTSLRSQRPARGLELQVRRCYADLNEYCKGVARRDGGARSDADVDDLTVAGIRARFSDRGGGLVYVDGEWHVPKSVFRGRRVFGDHEPFAPQGFDALWDVLAIREPTVGDCVRLLRALAFRDGSERERGLLIDVYQYVDKALEGIRQTPSGLRQIPLWTGGRWTTERPVYAIGQPEIARALGKVLPVWQPPCALAAVDRFASAAGAQILDEDAFTPQGIPQGALSAGGKARDHFRAAVREFARLLAEIDPDAHRALRPEWNALEEVALAHSTRLEVEVSVAGRGRWAVPVPVFVSTEPLLVAFTDIEALASFDRGGHAIATLFGGGDRDKIALLWREAWERGDPDNMRDAIRLAREREVTEDPLVAMAATQATNGKAKLTDRRLPGPPRPTSARGTRSLARTAATPRRLRSIDEFDASHVSIRLRNDQASRGTTIRREPHRIRSAAEITGSTIRTPPATQEDRRTPRGYTDEERETLGFQVLAKALEAVDDSQLGDLRRLRGIGADAVDDLRRFVELKAHGGDIPPSVTLTRSELQRALEQGPNFLLALVGGLEEGADAWRVLLVADPVRSLNLVAGADVTLTGVHTKRALEIVAADVEQPPSTV